MIILSSNQWKCDYNAPAWAAMGEDCSAEARVPKLVRAYREIGADILGLQETSPHIAELMMDLMRPDGYDYLWGGDTPIVYRADKFSVKTSGFFRFDETVPGYPGSFNNQGTKSFTWAVLDEPNTGRRLAVCSVHLWYMTGNPERKTKPYQAYSAEARAYQITLACRKMNEVCAEFGCPGVIMGDFNCSMGSLCLNAALADGWQEVHDVSRGDRAESKGHHFCKAAGYKHEEPGVFAHAIDHMLIKFGGTVNHFRRFMPTWFDNVSDHYPLYIDYDPEETQ